MSFLLHPLKLRLRFAGGTILWYGLLFFLTFAATGTTRLIASELSDAMKTFLVCLPMQLVQFDTRLPPLATVDLCLATIYSDTGSEPLWVSIDGPSEKGAIILKHLMNSSQHGLDPKDYKVDRIRELWSSRSPDELVELDTLLTYNIVKYVHDISYGRLKPLESDPQLFPEAGDKDFNLLLTIRQLLSTGDLDLYLTGLPPQHYHYAALKTALEQYRKIAEKGEWPKVTEGASLRLGDNDERIIAVRKRLQFTDPLLETPQDAAPATYDPQLEAAVRVFQQQHGLEVDGIIGKKTIAAMNITVADKIEAIRINMARWRWQAHDLGPKYVLVNIANFSLRAFQGQNTILDIPIIVGKKQNETPVFSAKIRYLDFNPFWNVPTSIAKKEELPELRKNSNYLIDNHIRLFSSWQEGAVELDSTEIDWQTVSTGQISAYKLRQDPGPWNALGKIKFVFPNRYSVYMHDTPAHNLFNRNQRSFSHGCVRVSDVLSLAIFLLEDQGAGWDPEKIKEIYNQDERKVVILSNPVPVHITYQTTWVDKSGTIHFNKDIYARDERLRNALFN